MLVCSHKIYISNFFKKTPEFFLNKKERKMHILTASPAINGLSTLILYKRHSICNFQHRYIHRTKKNSLNVTFILQTDADVHSLNEMVQNFALYITLHLYRGPPIRVTSLAGHLKARFLVGS